MEGQKIMSLDHLQDLVYKKRAVIIPKSWSWNRPRPAAFMIHLPGTVLLGLFEIGMYLYEKESDHEPS